MTTQAQRRELAACMDMLVAHEPKVHYAETRPMHLWPYRDLERLLTTSAGVKMDCSWSVTELCYQAGLKDPNGLNFDGSGDTQTMFDHLPHYTNPASAGVGALVFFGIPGKLSSQHVAMVRHTGTDPILFSHGSERAPLYLPLNVERRAHVGQVVFLNISRL